jgi:hypothetical protein
VSSVKSEPSSCPPPSIYVKLFDDLKLCLCSGGQQGSELSFGEVDTTKYQGQIYWTPVTAQTYWQIGIQGSGSTTPTKHT